MELLTLILSSFWAFVGTIILIYAIGDSIGYIVKQFKKGSKND